MSAGKHQLELLYCGFKIVRTVWESAAANHKISQAGEICLTDMLVAVAIIPSREARVICRVSLFSFLGLPFNTSILIFVSSILGITQLYF